MTGVTMPLVVGVFSALSVVSGLAGCADVKAEREWTVEDHGQPKQQGSTQAAPSEPDAPPVSAEEAQARAMSALWKVTCAGCHGLDGRGGGSGLPPGARVPDLTDATAMAGKTDEQLAAVILSGRGMMPAFGPQIGGEAGAKALVAHVRLITKRAGPRAQE